MGETHVVNRHGLKKREIFPVQLQPMSGNAEDAKEYDADLLGFGHQGDGDEDEKVWDDINVDGGDDVKLADLDTKFTRSPLWEAPAGTPYDGRDAGPTNMPDGYKKFSPLQIFLLLFPVELFRLIVTQTNLYYLQGAPEVLEPLMTLKELFVFVALHMMMLNSWTGAQNDFFLGKAGFDATQYMTRQRFYWIKRHLHFADKTQRVPEGTPGWDPLYLIRPLVDTLNATFKKYWKLSAYVSLDGLQGSQPFSLLHPTQTPPEWDEDARYLLRDDLLLRRISGR